MEQTGRERVKRAVEFGTPDRIPFLHNLNRAPEFAHGQALLDLYRRYPDDFGWRPEESRPAHHECGDRTRDAWGIEWEWPGIDGYVAMAVGHPLADDDVISSYRPPPFDEEGYRAYQMEALSRLNEGAYRLLLCGSIHHQMIHLRGFDNVMMDTVLRNDAFYFVRDLAMEQLRNEVRVCCELHCDEIMVGDDWGSQVAPFIRPEQWRALYLPLYEEIAALIHAAGRKFHFHCDGMILPLISDFIAAGADVINVEHTLIGLEELGWHFRGKICFRSNTDRQHLLTRPDREAIRADIEAQIRHLSTPEGGMVFYAEPPAEAPLEVHRIVLEEFDRLRDRWKQISV